MTLAETRALLRSSQPNVLVEAPAGCGKTFEAAELAHDAGRELPDGASVLVLAHTNAAIQEFARRVRNTGARVRAMTIDSFCVDLLEPYASRLGLPFPLRRHVGLGAARFPFSALAPAAANLLSRCNAIAAMLAARHPVVILDEHQDSNLLQHQVVSSFGRRNGCRIRSFGDPMQAIYEGDTAGNVTWGQLISEAQSSCSLTEAQRWRDDRALGDWILAARTELKAGRPLPLRDAPPSVTVRRVRGLRCAGFGYGNAGHLARPVQDFTRNAEGSVAVLSRHNNHVWGLHIAAGGRLRLNEGADYERAYTLLEEASANKNSAQRMALCLVEHVRSVSTGFDAAKCDAIRRALRPDHIEYGRHGVLRSFLECFQPLYDTPSLDAFCQTAKLIREAPPSWLTIRMPVSMRLIGQVRVRSDDDPLECLDAIVARIKAGAGRLARSVSTVHKAKGLEYDHVMIGNFSAAHFSDDEMSRRIAYVALSRARRSIALLVPEQQPSPLLG
jgi:DNA helicase-2/ATP-dependent DNA helicase PcrA